MRGEASGRGEGVVLGTFLKHSKWSSLDGPHDLVVGEEAPRKAERSSVTMTTGAFLGLSEQLVPAQLQGLQ